MKTPRDVFAKSLLRLAPAVACLLALGADAPARRQQPPPARSAAAARGVELYSQGKLEEAEDVLRAAVKADKTDAESWYQLGLVLNRAGKAKDARKAFESAVKRRPAHAESHAGLGYTLLVANKPKEAERAALRAIELEPRSLAARYTLGVVRLRQGRPADGLAEAEESIKVSPDFAAAHRLRGQAYVNLYADDIEGAMVKANGGRPRPAQPDPARSARRRQYLAEAARSFEKYMQLAPDSPEAQVLRDQLDTLRVYASAAGPAEPAAYTSDQVTTKVAILSRPEPLYTESARKEGVEGSVILRMVLAADGQVKHILVVRGLSHGLTENVINAARRIKFTPATKDGRPVSQFVTIKYTFNIY